MNNMLGNSESLRELFQGPITDLLVKLNGENGQETLVELNKFNRREPCWVSGAERTVAPPVIVSPTLFKASDTDLDYWLDQTQKFTKKHLGVEVNLRERFAIPAELPWKSVLPVFDPGNLDNRGMVEKALKGLGLNVYEETDVMNYASSAMSGAPTLHLIENSIIPNADTMGKSPNDLRETKKLYLRLRGYGLAFALCFSAKKVWLDSQTWTWFPEDRLSDGDVANGYWDPGYRKVGFDWSDPGDRRSSSGARVAMPVSLKT